MADIAPRMFTEIVFLTDLMDDKWSYVPVEVKILLFSGVNMIIRDVQISSSVASIIRWRVAGVDRPASTPFALHIEILSVPPGEKFAEESPRSLRSGKIRAWRVASPPAVSYLRVRLSRRVASRRAGI